MTFTIEKIANMVFITDETNQIWKSWMADEATEKKINNAVRKLQASFNNELTFINKL